MASAVASSGAPSSRPYSTWLWRSTKPIGSVGVSHGTVRHNCARCSTGSRVIKIQESGPRSPTTPGRRTSMAQPEKRENSVLFSLRELRQIEENRVQEEEHAVRSAEEQRTRAQQEAERMRREAEEAKVREERDHHRSIEESRLAQEREARLRVESAAATENARQ